VSLRQEAHHQVAEVAECSWQEADDSLHHIIRGPDGELFEFINTR